MSASATEPISLKTVVIDAGHGGTDPGAVSPDRRTYEKSLTLDISKRLATKIECTYPNLKVILTRPDDKFVELEQRASSANKAGADLFISIHINSSRSTSPNGYSVHVLGESSNKNRDLFAYNMDVCKRENSVILLEDDYNTKYQGFDPSDPESFIFMQLMQNSHLEQSLMFAQMVASQLQRSPLTANRGIWQNPFLVLWRTAMPSVLVELGFLSNSQDITILRSETNRDKIAECLKNAFVEYKSFYDGSVATVGKKDTVSASLAKPDTHPEIQPASEGQAASGKDQQTTISPSSAAPVPSGKETQQTPASASAASATMGNPQTKPEVLKTEPNIMYGTQIMAGSRRLSTNDKAFLGYSPLILEVNGIYKYVIGVSDSAEKAVENYHKIRKTYQQAFLVKVTDGIFPAPYRPETLKNRD